MTQNVLAIFLCLFAVGATYSQDITGKWKTIDDESGKARSVVDIFKKGDRYYGKVVQIFTEPGDDPDPVCDDCEGVKKNQKVIGMEIIEGLKYDTKERYYSGGDILDPENGNVYDCRIWLSDDGNLKVRGYLYFLYRTQTWLPYDQ